jgi:outer membrane receptor for ferrienterochelin and colicins
LEFFRTPDIYGFASMSFKTPLFNVELSAEYTGRMKAPHYEGFIAEDRLETTTPFCVVNLKFHKRFNFAENSSVSVFIGGFNLMNAYQSDLDMGADRDSGYVYGPAKPRSFYAGFEIRL